MQKSNLSSNSNQANMNNNSSSSIISNNGDSVTSSNCGNIIVDLAYKNKSSNNADLKNRQLIDNK